MEEGPNKSVEKKGTRGFPGSILGSKDDEKKKKVSESPSPPRDLCISLRGGVDVRPFKGVTMRGKRRSWKPLPYIPSTTEPAAESEKRQRRVENCCKETEEAIRREGEI